MSGWNSVSIFLDCISIKEETVHQSICLFLDSLPSSQLMFEYLTLKICPLYQKSSITSFWTLPKILVGQIWCCKSWLGGGFFFCSDPSQLGSTPPSSGGFSLLLTTQQLWSVRLLWATTRIWKVAQWQTQHNSWHGLCMVHSFFFFFQTETWQKQIR